MTKLVIVESPAKARTISKYLGPGYSVRASLGHVRDLPPDDLGVDVERAFKPSYRILPGKRKAVRDLKTRIAQADALVLATDPDREGEAIAWHVLQACRPPKQLPISRVVFHSITPEAIREAFAQERQLDMDLVNAQQARRILDRLVGYTISPLLGRKVQWGLSAGRVQSVAVRLVVDREREIQGFEAEEYWSVEADLSKLPVAVATTFRAVLLSVKGQKLDKFGLRTQADAQAIVDDLQGASYRVQHVETRRVSRQPPPPFITSTMQRAASSKLGMAPSHTMRVAQQLYEGVDTGSEGHVGLITYPRSDAPAVAPEAQAAAREYIAATWGEEFLPAQPPQYTAAGSAQEAHEAIRPTSVQRTPESIQAQLSPEQFRLYELAWKRFVASQMAPAVFDQTTADIAAGPEGATPAPYIFRATGSAVVFPGFLQVYAEEDDEEEDSAASKALPPLAPDEPLALVRLWPEQHFTKPPARYSEATLIKELERRGIGRPSTYATIMETILKRGYVEKEGRATKKAPLHPTDIAFVVVDLLVAHFPEMFDYSFTAQMEARLDAIAAGQARWVQVLRDFYGPLAEALARAEREMIVPDPTAPICDRCGRPMVLRRGKRGPFYGCSGYPDCTHTRSAGDDGAEAAPGTAAPSAGDSPTCDRCGRPMVLRKGKGDSSFYGCSGYPECRHTMPLHGAKGTAAGQKKRGTATRRKTASAKKESPPKKPPAGKTPRRPASGRQR